MQNANTLEYITYFRIYYLGFAWEIEFYADIFTLIERKQPGKPKHDLTPVSKAEPLPARKRRTRHCGGKKNLDFEKGSVFSAKDKLKANEDEPGAGEEQRERKTKGS